MFSTVFVCFWVETSVGELWTWQWTYIFWLVEQLSASEEGLCCVDLVSWRWILTRIRLASFVLCFLVASCRACEVSWTLTWHWNCINPLNPELNPICYLLALLGAHHFLHLSRIRVKSLTLRRLMSYIYGAPILDVSRSHTTTQHGR